MKTWTHQPETDKLSEEYQSEMGLVRRIGPGGWDAWAYLPKIVWVEQFQRNMKDPNQIHTHKVGECYKSPASAKAAVKRCYENNVGKI